MENKFHNTKKQNFLQEILIVSKGCISCNNQQAERKQSAKSCSNKIQRIIQDLPGACQEFVDNIEWYLPGEGSGSDVRLAGGNQRNWQLQRVKSNPSICFIKLFRKRLHYESLGIPVTTLELIYMEDQQGRKDAHRHDNCTQKERLEGGHRLKDNICPCGFAEQAAECHMQSKQKYDCDQCRMDTKHGKYLEGYPKQEHTQSSSRYNEAAPGPFVPSCRCCQAERMDFLARNAPPPESKYCQYSLEKSDLDQSQKHGLERKQKSLHLPGWTPSQETLSNRFHSLKDESEETVQVLLDHRTPRKVFTDDPISTLPQQNKKSDDELDYPEPPATLSSVKNDSRFGSTDTLNEVWCNPSVYDQAAEPRQSGCDHPIAIGPILDDESARGAFVRAAHYMKKYEKLNREQRSQDIAQRLHQLRLFQDKASRNYYNQLLSDGTLERRQRNTANKDTMHYKCPMGTPGCASYPNESLLSHFLSMHLSEPNLVLKKLHESDQILILFKPSSFKRSCNVCLSMIVYAGFKDKPLNLPGPTIFNAGLPRAFAKYSDFMPLFVMACRSRLKPSVCRQMRALDEQQQKKLFSSESASPTDSEATFATANDLETSSPSDEEATENCMTLWMVSIATPQPVHAVMTVFNSRMDVIRSSIMQVRGLDESHNSEELMLKSKDCMRLSCVDLRLLTNDYREPIYLELSIRDYANCAPNKH